MILADVIHQKKIQKRKNKKATQLIDNAKESVSELQRLLNLSNKYLDKNDVHKNMEAAIKVVSKNSDSGRLEFFKEHGYLPKGLEKESYLTVDKNYHHDDVTMAERGYEDFIYKLDQTPKANLYSMKDIGEKLNLTIMPFKYASEDSYKSENRGWNKDNHVVDFAKECERNGYDCYMLGPISYLDVWKCITDKKDLSQMWTNQKHQSVLDAVSLSIPSFKNVMSRIEALEESVESCKGDSLKLQKQIDNVCDRVNANERKILKLEAGQKKIQEEFARVEKEKTKQIEVYRTPWISLDPILFAVPKGADIIFDDDQLVFLGPCWGPEFPDLMAELKDLTINKKLGSETTKKVARIWQNN